MSALRPLILRGSWWLILAATILGALAWLWVAWCEYPIYGWNDVRLLPAFAFRNGFNPYPLIGDGPVTTWIYGPVGIIVNLPATIADSVAGALHGASLVNAVVVLAPLALIFYSSAELRSRGLGICTFAFALSILLVPTPNLILQVPDHAAIAFGLLSTWCLAHRAELGRVQIIAGAGFAVVALWAKQIAVFLPVAHVVYLLLTHQRATVRPYILWFGGFNVAALLAFGGMFGFENLWVNMFEIPARLGWADISSRITQRQWPLVAQVVLPILALIVIWRTGRWPSRTTESGRLFCLGTLSYGAMLPIGLFAFFKIGGDTNLLHSWDYLLPAVLLAWLSKDRGMTKDIVFRLSAVGLAFFVHRRDFRRLPERPYTQQFVTAAELTTRYPGTIWFPQNPLITYFAHQKLWHSEDGVSTRFLAGYGIREADFKAHLPPDLQAIAYPSANNSPFSMRLFTHYSEKQRVPYWFVFTRPTVAQPIAGATDPNFATPVDIPNND